MQQYRSDPRYPKDNQFAEENRARIVRSFPPRLIEREDSLAARFKKNKGSPLRKLEQLYAVMDEFLDVMAPHLPCKPGCSHCCHMKQLALTELEVELIEKRTKHQRRKTLAPTPEKGEPCPFLKDNRCTIYAARPFLCRRHVVLTPTPYWCDVERDDAEFPLIAFTGIDDAYGLIVVESGHTTPIDIRMIFDSSRQHKQGIEGKK